MTNEAQKAFWNGDTGQNWVTHDDLMEAMLQPIGHAVLDVLSPEQGANALDIGCGCGHQSLSLAERVGPEGSVTGIDISAPMLALARQLAQADATPRGAVSFLEADAQEHGFAEASFDCAFSRFGVMFFEHPHAAFSNIHRAMKPGAQLAFCCWQPRAVNPFMTLPARAAMALLPPPPDMPPRAPGPFAFEEPEYIEEILGAAAFNAIDISPMEAPLVFGRGLALREIVENLVNIGPIAQLMREAPAELQEPVREKVVGALEPFYTENSGITLDGRFWVVTATA